MNDRTLADLGHLPEPGVLYRKRIGPRVADITPLLFGQAALNLGRAIYVVDVPEWDGYDDVYTYASIAAAIAALLAWDGEAEPGGWHRHQPSGRRRPGGDAGREYVAP